MFNIRKFRVQLLQIFSRLLNWTALQETFLKRCVTTLACIFWRNYLAWFPSELQKPPLSWSSSLEPSWMSWIHPQLLSPPFFDDHGSLLVEDLGPHSPAERRKSSKPKDVNFTQSCGGSCENGLAASLRISSRLLRTTSKLQDFQHTETHLKCW